MNQRVFYRPSMYSDLFMGEMSVHQDSSASSGSVFTNPESVLGVNIKVRQFTVFEAYQVGLVEKYHVNYFVVDEVQQF